VSRRYERKSTVVITNKTFADWREVFPNAACVVSPIDRLRRHRSPIAGSSLSWTPDTATNICQYSD